jgi:glycosyltransferase involved in cell wall biosynthesis
VKLLIYSHFFAPSIGGVQTIVLSLARGLAELPGSNGAREFEITLVTQEPPENYDDRALPFRVVRRPGFFQLWHLIRSCDVLHIAGPALAPLSLGLLSRKPVVIEHHGFHTICPNGQLLIEPGGIPCPGHFMAHRYSECLRCNATQGLFASWKLWLLTFVRQILCARAAANITPTQWLSGLLQLPRVTAIPHGLEFTNPDSAREPLSGRPVFAFLGRLVTTKGVRLLLDAAKILRGQNRSFELLIIGDGPERAALQQFVRDSKLETQVRFAGYLEGEQLEASLARAFALVVPSLGGEVFGLVLAENMARGLPIVASDLGAFTEVLGDAGLTFRTGDAMDLATALARLLDDPSLAAALGHRAPQRSRTTYALGNMIQSHVVLYARSLHPNRKRQRYARMAGND